MQHADNNFYECKLLRVLNHETQTKRPGNAKSSESMCNIRFYSTFLKISGIQNGVEEMIKLDRKSRISWIWADSSEYKNSISHFKGFVLSRSLLPESKKEEQNHAAASTSNGGASQSNSSKISLSSASSIGATDPAVLCYDQKVQLICYFPPEMKQENKEYIISYLKFRVIQRNFHFVYQAISRLGKGSFAAVFLVNLNDSQKQFAVKAFLKEKLIEEDKGYVRNIQLHLPRPADSFYNEIMMMRSINHRSCISLIEVWESANSYYFILPVYHGGSLMERIALTKRFQRNQLFFNNNENTCNFPQKINTLKKDIHPSSTHDTQNPSKNPLSTPQQQLLTNSNIRCFMEQMLSALLILKQRGILHRDLKPDNILLADTSSVTPIIIDFGLATHMHVPQYIYPKCGTPGFVAPEIINMVDKSQRQTPQCDIFSLGSIFYLMLALKPLFMAKLTKDTIELNKACKIDFKDPAFIAIDPKARNLLKRMLEVNPEKRITVEEALQHEYFKGDIQVPIDEYDDDCFDVPEDPKTSIDSLLPHLGRSRFIKTSSLESSSFILDRGNSRKESSYLNTSLVMRQPIRQLRTRNRIISLDEVTNVRGNLASVARLGSGGGDTTPRRDKFDQDCLDEDADVDNRSAEDIAAGTITRSDSHEGVIKLSQESKNLFASPQYMRLKGTFDAQEAKDSFSFCGREKSTLVTFSPAASKIKSIPQQQDIQNMHREFSNVLKERNTSPFCTPSKQESQQQQQQQQQQKAKLISPSQSKFQSNKDENSNRIIVPPTNRINFAK